MSAHDAIEVGKRLKILREALNMSQVALCRATGIGDQVWNNAETGDNLLTVPNAVKLCRVTGVTMDWIYLGQVTALPFSLLNAIIKKTRPAGGLNTNRARDKSTNDLRESTDIAPSVGSVKM